MNIKIVSEKTGLTKKAIKYYEGEGLINPLKNSENNYREYNENDIVKLNLIGALRAVDIPVVEIKFLVEGNKNMKEVLSDTLGKINETITNLEKSRLVIGNILGKDLKDDYDIGEQVKKLRETLELSAAEKKEFISAALLRIFPGGYGKMVVNSYAPFLNIAIESEEKKEAWLKLVDFLDDVDEADSNNPFIRNMENLNGLQAGAASQNSSGFIVELLSGDDSVKEKYKNNMIMLMRFISQNEEARKKVMETHSQMVEMFNGMDSENTFNKCLEVLSEEYKRFMEVFKKLNEEVNEFFKK